MIEGGLTAVMAEAINIVQANRIGLCSIDLAAYIHARGSKGGEEFTPCSRACFDRINTLLAIALTKADCDEVNA